MAFRLTSSDWEAERGSSSLRRISDSNPCNHINANTQLLGGCVCVCVCVCEYYCITSGKVSDPCISVYLRAIKSHTGKHGLGNTGPLQLVPDLLVNVKGDFGP